MDVGHDDPKDVLIWLYDDGHVFTARRSSGTHEEVWGVEAMNFWRGRYDGKTGELSATGPVLFKGSHIPQTLIDALEARFGGDIEIFGFNPAYRKTRR